MTDPSNMHRLNPATCPDCGGTGKRPPDGKDSMGLPRWGPEELDNRVDKQCAACGGTGRHE